MEKEMTIYLLIQFKKYGIFRIKRYIHIVGAFKSEELAKNALMNIALQDGSFLGEIKEIEIPK